MYSRPWIALALCAGLALTACRDQHSASAPAKDAVVVHVYSVPPQRAEAISNALNDVFAVDRDHPPVGRASMVDGRVAVRAPSATQESVAEAIKALVNGDAASAVADIASVRLRFWFLRSVAASKAEPDTRLAALKPVLDEIGRTMGQGAFELVDFAEILALPGQGRVSTQTSHMTQIAARLMPDDRGILLEAELSTPSSAQLDGKSSMTSPPNLRTSTRLKADEFVVLNISSDDAAGGGLRLVVVQAQPQGRKD